ncbi:uncharacterized protein LOC110105871 isoform X2 [Dendrobium catenatum]|uniref:uncharacterized protein LOC110105871 isoform X2 n=1 Tax=Dendrobium catenatum TaxID=906689 RepID=UPI0010A02C75|nr:uncharacterized protein LOC110105871 isoform X2 [Dendrobium catenatum]
MISNGSADGDNDFLEKRRPKDENEKQSSLVQIVFSWSLSDIFNCDLFKGKVQKIPETFTSLEHYFGSFSTPLIEETHEDLRSSLETFSDATAHVELQYIQMQKSKKLFYRIKIKNANVENGFYQPMNGDIFVLTRTKPRDLSDLTRNATSYITGYVDDSLDFHEYIVELSRKLEIRSNRESFFIAFLLNMTTSIRIWDSLNLKVAKERNLSIINEIVSYISSVRKESSSPPSSPKLFLNACVSDNLERFNLNDSQKYAVQDCLSMRQKNHKEDHIKLIWGPPGTGKTKTTSTLILALLQLGCRTLICAPTNTAVVEVASRFYKLFKYEKFIGKTNFSIGDIILFGNSNRMKIDDDLSEIFLEHRAKILLEKCFNPVTGWRHLVRTMIDFLENAASQYKQYVENEMRKKNEKKNENIKEILTVKTFNEYVLMQYHCRAKQLEECIKVLCNELPRTFIPYTIFKDMNIAIDLMKVFKNVLISASASHVDLKNLFKSEVEKGKEKLPCVDPIIYLAGYLSIRVRLRKAKTFLWQLLRHLSREFNLPKAYYQVIVEKICLKEATLIFCTACSSFRLQNILMRNPLKFLIVDEAAQLKECESLIPLQISGIENVVLIGDEIQLPAMVKSKISEMAGYGRSLFERLSSLGQEKNLLNIQYRMHPSISSFPNSNFYENKISDGENVLVPNYQKQYLSGLLYGPYSFINIGCGKEVTDKDGRSKKNLIEVEVVAKIVEKLFKVSKRTNQKLSVGVLSPYTAQVFAINEKIGKKHCLWILGNEATLSSDESIWLKIINDAKKRRCFHSANDDKDLSKAIFEACIKFDELDNLLNMDSLQISKTKRFDRPSRSYPQQWVARERKKVNL